MLLPSLLAILLPFSMFFFPFSWPSSISLPPFTLLLLSLLIFCSSVSARPSSTSNGGNLRHIHANKQFIDQLEEGSYEIVHPFQIRERKDRVGIDTRDHFRNSTRPAHHRHVTLVIRSTVLAGARLKLGLALNEHIVHEKSRIRKRMEEGEPAESTEEGPPVENCYYQVTPIPEPFSPPQGTINGHPDSLASLSTCAGLLGLLELPNGTSLAIWPLEGGSGSGGEHARRHPHVLYRARMGPEGARCAAQTPQATEMQQRKRRDNAGGGGQRRANKFVELALVGDAQFMGQSNFSQQKAVEYALSAVNLADSLLRRDLGVRLSVTFAEFWSPSLPPIPTPPPIDSQHLLGSFLDYATGHLYDVEKDAAVMLTGRGMAAGDTMAASFASACTSRAVGVIKIGDPFRPHLGAVSLAHSIAHILGIDHDSSQCNCEGAAGGKGRCLMAERASALGPLPLHFSHCSVARLHSLLHHSASPQLQCLFLRPFQSSRLYQCGNGVLDSGEQCDCGRRDQCDDPCCDPLSCQLRPHAQCASHQPCCQHCQLRAPGHVCRQSQSVCDVAEKCDGTSGECPPDEYLVDGVLCGISGHCWKGHCVDGERQCRQLWGPGAKPADELCFGYNTRAVEYGNCGRDAGGRFVECAPENSRCGVLHCRGGGPSTLAPNATSFNLQFAHQQRQVQCKVVTNSEEGIVRDGSSCGPGRVCVQSVCVPLAQVSPPVHCPSNNMALQCSGHGDCTTGHHCLCFDGWSGPACDVRVPDSSSRGGGLISVAPGGSAGIELVVPTFRVNGKALETATLLGILLLVGLLLLLLLICLLLFYKRKSSTRPFRRGMGDQSKVADEEECEGGGEEAGRAIKFGQMPSYREEKRKRKANKRVYDALQRITELNEADSVSVKSRESSSVGAITSDVGRAFLNNSRPSGHSSSPSALLDNISMPAATSAASPRPPSAGADSRYSASPALAPGDLSWAGFSAAEQQLHQGGHELSATSFVAPPRLAHIQMLMRRLEGTMAGREEEGGCGSQPQSPGGRAPPTASSADSGNPEESHFDVRGESPSLFSDPYKLDRLDLPG